ncbi:MAG: hypothetical protein K6356_08730 [Chloroflexus sp.]
MHRWCVLLLTTWIFLAASPVAAQSAQTFTLDFEGFSDNLAIGEYGGLTFSPGWRFGDVRSGRYNAPYPDDCPDFGGICAFAINGNGFARVSGDGRGQIFLPADVSIFRVAVATSEALTLTAFATDGTVLDTVVVEANIFSGRLERVTLTAPKNYAIAMIEVSGVRDTWLLDDVQYIVLPLQRAQPARLVLAQRVVDAVQPGEVVTIGLVLENYGRGAMRAATIELPFDDTALILLDVIPDRADVWVSDVQPGLVTIRTGSLAPVRDLLTINVRFQVRDKVPSGLAIGRVAHLWYRDDLTDGAYGRSNLPRLTIGVNTVSVRTPELVLNGQTLSYAAEGFAPGEPVGVWYNPPNGASPVAVTTVRADGDGRVSGSITVSNWPTGEYTLVLYSHYSQQTFVGAFPIQP